MNRRRLLLATAALGVAAAGGCRPGSDRDGGFPRSPIVTAAGSTVGVYYQYANAIAGLARPRFGPMDVLPTTGSVDNLLRLHSGQATLAFTAADAATDALGGTPPDPPIPIRAIAKLYDDYIHLVVPQESTATAITDLHGRRVSVGAAGSGTALIADRLLAAAGIDPHAGIQRLQLPLDDSAQALATGTIDAFFWSGGLPTVAITGLDAHRPVRLLDLRTPAGLLRSRFGTCYRIGVIPPGTYQPQPKPVPTLAVPNLLVALDTQPDEAIYNLADFIFANAPALGAAVPVAAELDRHTALYTEPIPLHNGALAYYRQEEIA